jgi:general secretion pathway protein L
MSELTASARRPVAEVLLGAEPRQTAGGDGFFTWWAGELAQLLPARGRALPRGDFIVALYDGATIQLAASGRRGIEELGVVDCPTAERGLDRNAALLAEQVRHSGLPLVLRLAPELGLEAFDRLPRAARKELRQIVANRIDGLTPWAADAVLFDTISVTPAADGMLDVVLAVAPRRSVQRATETLELLGLVPDVIDLGDGDAMGPPTHDLGRAGHRRHLPRFVPIAGGLFVFAALAAGIFAYFDAQSRAAALDQRRAYAAMLEQRLEDLPSLRARIADLESEGRAVLERHLARPSALMTIETLSRLLPDNVWLESLTLAEGRLQLAGYGSDAARLPSLLEGHPSFHSAALTASSERLAMPRGPDEIVEVDRFSLQVDVRPNVEEGP